MKRRIIWISSLTEEGRKLIYDLIFVQCNEIVSNESDYVYCENSFFFNERFIFIEKEVKGKGFASFKRVCYKNFSLSKVADVLL